jgi:hypothetical protein
MRHAISGLVYVSEEKFRGNIFIMLCVLRFGLTIRDGTVSTSFHLSLHEYVIYLF